MKIRSRATNQTSGNIQSNHNIKVYTEKHMIISLNNGNTRREWKSQRKGKKGCKKTQYTIKPWVETERATNDASKKRPLC